MTDVRRAPNRLPASALAGRGGLLRLSQARAAGWSTDAARHAVDTDRLRRERPGLYRIPTADSGTSYQRQAAAHLRCAQASVELCERAAIGHAAAAIALGLPTVCSLDRPCVTVQAGTALRRLAKVHLHRATLREDDIVVVDGFPVLSAARTVTDLAREHGVDAGVAAADQALRSGLVTGADLTAALTRCDGWPGARSARAAVLCADPGAESPLESLSRLRILRAGLPAPRLQASINDRFGRFVARTDFYWDRFGVVGESDGNVKYDDRAAIVAERRRQQALEDLGLIVVRWEWADLRNFEVVVRRLRLAFARGIDRPARARGWVAS